jgi:hypothetical protein
MVFKKFKTLNGYSLLKSGWNGKSDEYLIEIKKQLIDTLKNN